MEHITTSISPELYKLAKQHNIAWSEALRVGISIILMELGIMEYDNRINVIRKIDMLNIHLNDLAKTNEILQEKLSKYEK